MNIISKKRTKDFSIFLILSGLLFGVLVFLWYLEFYSKGGGGILFSSLPVLLYYIFLAILLPINGILLFKKKYKLFSVFSLLLFFVFLGSLFIKVGIGWHILRTLFFSTVYLGMSAGGLYGGSIIIPMFLISVFYSGFRAFMYFSGKISYENNHTLTDIKDNRVYFLQKDFFHKVLPVLAILTNFFNFKRSLQIIGILFENFKFNFLFLKDLFLGGLPVLLFILAVFSFFIKDKKVYKFLNIIILILLFLPYIAIWIFR